MQDKCMAVKTIMIDLEAHEALARHKRKGDSFSRVIKEHFGRRRTGRDLAALVGQLRLAEHSKTEPRCLALGQTDSGRLLFISFTVRQALIRVISARDTALAPGRP
jgi:predicted CopG family antitoxin